MREPLSGAHGGQRTHRCHARVSVRLGVRQDLLVALVADTDGVDEAVLRTGCSHTGGEAGRARVRHRGTLGMGISFSEHGPQKLPPQFRQWWSLRADGDAPAHPQSPDPLTHTPDAAPAPAALARPARSDLHAPPEESELLGAAEAALRVAPCGRGLHSLPSRAPSALTGSGGQSHGCIRQGNPCGHSSRRTAV